MAWRGQVTHVLSGEVRYFREWLELADFLRQTRRIYAAVGESSSSLPNAMRLSRSSRPSGAY